MKENMQRQIGMIALVDIGEGFHQRAVGTEEFIENDQADLEVFVKARIEELECQVRVKESEAGTPGRPRTPVGKSEETKGTSLNKLTRSINNQKRKKKKKTIRDTYRPPWLGMT